ncbi:MAG: hypothetical protein IJ309_04815 [Clostridia bacterium]|nr:hypothetical protein [Clostridia bacterium]
MKKQITAEVEDEKKPKKEVGVEPPTFLDTLEKMLGRAVPTELLPESIKASMPNGTATYQEAVLMAMIIKAMGGDTQASVYLRDTSGNKLKDGARVRTAKKRFEDF